MRCSLSLPFPGEHGFLIFLLLPPSPTQLTITERIWTRWGHIFLFAVLGARDTECACLSDCACLRLNFSNFQVLEEKRPFCCLARWRSGSVMPLRAFPT